MNIDVIIATINNDRLFLNNILDPFENNEDKLIHTSRLSYINYQDPLYGNTALHYAVKMGNFELVQMLLLYGADRKLRNLKGITPLDEYEDKYLTKLAS